jgi:hypothetical protein
MWVPSWIEASEDRGEGVMAKKKAAPKRKRKSTKPVKTTLVRQTDTWSSHKCHGCKYVFVNSDDKVFSNCPGCERPIEDYYDEFF